MSVSAGSERRESGVDTTSAHFSFVVGNEVLIFFSKTRNSNEIFWWKEGKSEDYFLGSKSMEGLIYQPLIDAERQGHNFCRWRWHVEAASGATHCEVERIMAIERIWVLFSDLWSYICNSHTPVIKVDKATRVWALGHAVRLTKVDYTQDGHAVESVHPSVDDVAARNRLQ